MFQLSHSSTWNIAEGGKVHRWLSYRSLAFKKLASKYVSGLAVLYHEIS